MYGLKNQTQYRLKGRAEKYFEAEKYFVERRMSEKISEEPTSSDMIVVGAKEVQELTRKEDVRKALYRDFLFCFFVFISLTIHMANIHIESKYDIEHSMKYSLLEKKWLDNSTTNNWISFSDIDSTEDMWEFVEEILIPELFQGDNLDTLPEYHRNYGLWGLRFRVMKRKSLPTNYFSDTKTNPRLVTTKLAVSIIDSAMLFAKSMVGIERTTKRSTRKLIKR